MHSTREDRPAKLAAWRQRIRNETVFVTRDRGALWSGVGAQNAGRLATTMGLTTLEMTPLGASLDHGTMKADLDRDFGPLWIAEKREVFKEASLKFVGSLTGLVTVFLPQQFVRPADGAQGSFAYAVKIVWDELKEADFGDPRVDLQRITAMRVCRINAGQIVSDVFMSASNQIH